MLHTSPATPETRSANPLDGGPGSQDPEDQPLFVLEHRWQSSTLRRAGRQAVSVFVEVEVVGNTVFFTQHGNSPTRLLVSVKGYNHAFLKAYIT